MTSAGVKRITETQTTTSIKLKAEAKPVEAQTKDPKTQ
jgi:hypothetical protein